MRCIVGNIEGSVFSLLMITIPSSISKIYTFLLCLHPLMLSFIKNGKVNSSSEYTCLPSLLFIISNIQVLVYWRYINSCKSVAHHRIKLFFCHVVKGPQYCKIFQTLVVNCRPIYILYHAYLRRFEKFGLNLIQ